MHHTIGRIAGQVNDYVICNSCDSINWYENTECVNCPQKFTRIHKGTYDRIIGCRDMAEKDGEGLLKEYDEDELNVDSCELDV